MPDKLYIVMPAYNESAAIEDTVRHWHAVVEKTGPDSRLVIVNDGSTDNMFDKLIRLTAQYSQLIPLDKPNSGHGPTCYYAYQYAIKGKADYIFQTDSDGQTNAEEFWSFWEKRKEYDFIIGHRKGRKDGWSRVGVAKVLKGILRLYFGVSVKDPNTPFRLMKADRLQPLLEMIPADFFLCNVMISTLVVKRKERLIWLPISFAARKQGENSINFRKIIRIGMKAMIDFGKMRKKIKS
jgi:glycosyltransferase involved in cell wall biosynthesis